MRIRFTIDEDLDGYLNINPFTEIEKLSDNECSYIFCDNCIRGCMHDEIKKDLTKWVSKLRHGGIICIVGVEPNVLIDQYLYTKDLKDINSYIVEANGIYSLNLIKTILLELGLNIKNMSINSKFFTLEAYRC